MPHSLAMNPTCSTAAQALPLEEIQVAVVVYDAEGRAVRGNPLALDLLGLSAEELLGRQALPSGWALLDEDGQELSADQHPVARVLQARSPIRDFTVGIRRPLQNDVAWALVHAGPRIEPGGELSCVVVTWVDVTGRRQAELALRDSEIRYRTLFEHMDSAVLLMRGAACVACNPQTARLFGVQRAEDLLGKTPLDFAPERQPNGMSSAEMVRENIEIAVRDGSRTFEWYTVRADGTPIWLEVTFTPFALGGSGLFQCIARDITTRKQAEERLRRTEAQFREMVEHAHDGVVVADVADRRFRYVNPAICRMLGYEPAQLLSLTIRDIHPPGQLPAVMGHISAEMRREHRELLTECVRQDGSTLDVAVNAIPVEFEGTDCLVGFFRDETGRRQLEGERLRVQKLEALGVLAGGIAHDFNNLLQGVFGFISAARDAAGDKVECQGLLDEASRARELAVGLTTQLLTFSRGGRPVKQRIQPLVVAETASRFALSGLATTATYDLPSDLWSVEADPAQLAQVFQNIVLNAAQAMGGGGSVSLSARNVEANAPEVPMQLAPGRYVAIRVRDVGSGIAAEHLARIFDPYFTTKPMGAGLGLATAWSIVRNHGGLIEARSEVGQGTQFTVWLPAFSALDAPAVTLARGGEIPAARILLMDDEELVRTVGVRLLSRLGHHIDVSQDGAEAVALYQRAKMAGRPYDIVILDLTVRGGMGGLDALHLLRAVDPNVRAVVSSGYSDNAVLADPTKHGFVGRLPKPYSLPILEDTLRDLLVV